MEITGTTAIGIDNVSKQLEVIIAGSLPHVMILGDTSLLKGRGTINLHRNEPRWYLKPCPLRQTLGQDTVV